MLNFYIYQKYAVFIWNAFEDTLFQLVVYSTAVIDIDWFFFTLFLFSLF